MSADGDGWRITCEPSAVFEVRDALLATGLTVASAESTMVSSVAVDVTDVDDALGKGVVERIGKAGGKARYLHHDVRDEATWPGVIAEAELQCKKGAPDESVVWRTALRIANAARRPAA